MTAKFQTAHWNKAEIDDRNSWKAATQFFLPTGSALRGAVICFYLSNEALSLSENAAHLGLPVPDKLKDILGQLHRRGEKTDEQDEDKAH